MPEPNVNETLTKVRDLLREGRVTEGDRAIDALQEEIRQEEERRKRELPPPTPRTLPELESDWRETVTNLLGQHPRLAALNTEIAGKLKAAE